MHSFTLHYHCIRTTLMTLVVFFIESESGYEIFYGDATKGYFSS